MIQNLVDAKITENWLSLIERNSGAWSHHISASVREIEPHQKDLVNFYKHTLFVHKMVWPY